MRQQVMGVKVEVVEYQESPIADKRGLVLRMTFGDAAHADIQFDHAQMLVDDLCEAIAWAQQRGAAA